MTNEDRVKITLKNIAKLNSFNSEERENYLNHFLYCLDNYIGECENDFKIAKNLASSSKTINELHTNSIKEENERKATKQFLKLLVINEFIRIGLIKQQ